VAEIGGALPAPFIRCESYKEAKSLSHMFDLFLSLKMRFRSGRNVWCGERLVSDIVHKRSAPIIVDLHCYAERVYEVFSATCSAL
jgi:hypothetical protein